MKTNFRNDFLRLETCLKKSVIAVDGKQFLVRLKTRCQLKANKFMLANPETAIIDSDYSGIHWIVNIQEGV